MHNEFQPESGELLGSARCSGVLYSRMKPVSSAAAVGSADTKECGFCCPLVALSISQKRQH